MEDCMSLLAIKNLRLALGPATVLHDASLAVGEGDIVGLLGPNGAGKTTTMLAALGLLRPLSGEVRTFGRDPWREGPELRRKIGVLPDPNGFHDWMTAPDYLAFFAGLYGADLDDGSIARRLEAVGLSPRPRQTIGSFSRGMRQRLGLARALVADPALLVLDEPTNGLDPRGRRELHDLLAALAGRGVGVLLCTHLLDDVERLCTHASFIAGGCTVAEGRIKDLLCTRAGHARFRLELSGPVPEAAPAPAHVRIILRDPGWAVVDVDPTVQPDAAWRELLFLGWPITAITHEGGGLEAVYLDVVHTGGSLDGTDATLPRAA
jgi:ABC-2 type transport system ATP-binding protein